MKFTDFGILASVLGVQLCILAEVGKMYLLITFPAHTKIFHKSMFKTALSKSQNESLLELQPCRHL